MRPSKPRDRPAAGYENVDSLLRLQRDLAVEMLALSRLDAALERLLSGLCRIPGVDCGGVYRVDGLTGAAQLIAHQNLSGAFVAATGTISEGSQRAAVLLKGASIYVGGEALREADVNGDMRREGLRSVAVLPQLHEGRVVAALNLGSHTMEQFPLFIRPTLESLGAFLGSLIVRLDAQERLWHAQRNLTAVFETLRDMLFVADETGRVLHTNRAAQTALGLTAEALRGRALTDLHPTARRQDVEVVLADALAGRTDVCTIPLRSREGREIPVEIGVSRGEWSGRRALFGVARDMSEHLKAVQALRESEENFRNLAESSFDGILIVAADGRQVYANRRAAEMLGYTMEEILRNTQKDLVHPDEFPMLRQRLADRLAGLLPPSVYETRLLRKDGSVFPAEVSATLTLWQGSGCALAFFRDITERKRLQQEILTIGELEKNRIGRDLHDSIGQDLTGIALLAEALHDRLVTRGDVEAGAAGEIVSHARRTITRVQQVARGLLPLEIEPGNLPGALRQMTALVAHRAQVGCRMECPDPGAWGCPRDQAVHLYFIALEAVTNAVRHSGATSIVVRLERNGEEGVLAVDDDGCGCPACVQAESGLGMRIMRHRADLIGGRLDVTRRPGGGTSVRCACVIPRGAERGPDASLRRGKTLPKGADRERAHGNGTR